MAHWRAGRWSTSRAQRSQWRNWDWEERDHWRTAGQGWTSSEWQTWHAWQSPQGQVSSWLEDNEFEVCVRLLSGREVPILVSPYMSIGIVEDRLKEKLFGHRHDFHVVTLFHGTQELPSSDSVGSVILVGSVGSVCSVGLVQGMELQATTVIDSARLCSAISEGSKATVEFLIEFPSCERAVSERLLERTRLCVFEPEVTLTWALALAAACKEDTTFCVPRLVGFIGNDERAVQMIMEKRMSLRANVIIIGLVALGEAHTFLELGCFENSIVDSIKVSQVANKMLIHRPFLLQGASQGREELVRRVVQAVVHFVGKCGDMSAMHVLSDMRSVCKLAYENLCLGQNACDELLANLDMAREQVEARAFIQKEVNAAALPTTEDTMQQNSPEALLQNQMELQLAQQFALEEVTAPALPTSDIVTQEELQHSDPLLLEQEDLQRALLASKMDGPPPLSAEYVVLFRLTRYSEEIGEALVSSKTLEPIRAVVADAGCEIRPYFANGATLLMPVTAEQLAELDLALQPHHILARRDDQPAIEEALRSVPARRRPKMRFDHRADVADQNCNPESDVIDASVSNDRNEFNADVPALVEESSWQFPIKHGFVHFDVTKDVSDISSSHACHSEPCGNSSEHAQPKNVHRFALPCDR